MKLYIKQDIMSGLPHFFIKDETESQKYDARTKGGIQVGLKLYVYDMSETEVAYIEQKNLSLTPTFRVFRNGVQTATIVKKFSFLKPSYTVEELGWTIKGDFTAHEYTISNASGVVATVSKEWFAWGDAFVLDFVRCENELEALAVVFAIDCVVDTEGNGIEINGHGIKDVL